MAEITYALESVGLCDPRASDEILPLVYDDLRRHAGTQMSREASGQTLQPTALVHEAWLRLIGGKEQHWQNRAHFFGAAAETMRRILVENARKKSCLKRGGKQLHIGLDEIDLAETTPEEKILLVDDAVERLQLEDPERARVVVLKFFNGFTDAEAAATLGVTERTIERHWAFAKAWLFQNIQTAS